jgi:polyisoprenoid-binding protein YceI
MTFKSTKVAFSGDNPSVIEGDLTMVGVTKPVSLTVDRFKCNPASATTRNVAAATPPARSSAAISA